MIFDAVNFCAIFGFGPLNHSKTFTDFKIKNLVIFYIHLIFVINFIIRNITCRSVAFKDKKSN